MRRGICAALAAAALLCAPAKAMAAVTNGQLAGVQAGTIVTFNPDATGVRVLYKPASNGPIFHPEWSPDGNRIAFAESGHIAVVQLATGAVTALTSGSSDSDPGWTGDGSRVLFRRGASLMSVAATGGDERLVRPLPDTLTSAFAWGPQDVTARVANDNLYVDLADGSGEQEAFDGGVSGQPAWSADGLIAFEDDGDLWLTDLDSDPVQVGGAGATDPVFAPDGSQLRYMQGGDVWSYDAGTGQSAKLPAPAWMSSVAHVAWQPCTAGVTSSCISTSPAAPPPPAPFACPAAVPLTIVGGTKAHVELGCTDAHNYMTATPPAHGTVVATINGGVTYHANSDYSGPDSFAIRVWGSNLGLFAVVTVDVTVTPKPAAPTATVVGKPKLDRNGRVVLRVRCDRVCTGSLRVSVKLTTGRVILGRAVKAAGAPGRDLKVTLRRGTLPKHRKVAGARVVGTLTGLDGLKRNVSIALR